MTAMASVAQAKLLLRLWMDGPKPYWQGYNPTFDALVRRSWVCPTGDTIAYPNGRTGPIYNLTEAGWDAARTRLTRTTLE